MVALPAVIDKPSIVWCAPDLSRELRQSEIITGLTRYDFNSADETVEAVDVPWAIVLTQDCDLLGDFDKRAAGLEGELDQVILLTAHLVSTVKEITKYGSKEMKPLQQNLNPRWHFLEACPVDKDAAESGFDSLVVDFKGMFALPTVDLYHQCSADAPRRRAALDAPYREHMQLRAANFLSRIALPAPHHF